MERQKKVVAAVTAAVYAYMAEQQAQMERQKVQAPAQPFSPWVMAGRATAMQMRQSWQLRLVR